MKTLKMLPFITLLTLSSWGLLAQSQVDFNLVKTSILGPKCLSCHEDFAEEENVLKFIEPGSPEKSQLFTLVESGEMPQEGDPLSAEELELIKSYISSLKPPKDEVAPTFQELKARILVPHCLGCHKKMGDEYTMTKKWVNFSQPLKSLMMIRVKNGTMPKNAPKLNQEDQDFLASYLQGAVKPESRPTLTRK